MADLQPPKQAPEDPGAHELEGTTSYHDSTPEAEAHHTNALQNPQTTTSPQRPRVPNAQSARAPTL
jgi:hypothetical protein